MTARSTRYEVYVSRADGSREMVQCNAQRLKALVRANIISKDIAGWPTVTLVEVIDTAAVFTPRVLLSLKRES